MPSWLELKDDTVRLGAKRKETKESFFKGDMRGCLRSEARFLTVIWNMCFFQKL